MKSKKIHYKVKRYSKVKTAQFVVKARDGKKVLGHRDSKVLISRRSPTKPNGDAPIKKPKIK